MNDYIEEYSKGLKISTTKIVENLSCYYKGNWVLDVGSNTGMFIESFLDKFPDTHILAFEPVKKYYEFSIDHFRNKPNVFIENAALGNADEAGEIFVAKNNIGWNTLIRDKIDEDNRDTVETIRIKKFDLYLDYTGLDVVFDIVKIDTEGYEYKVLNGMRNFIKAQRPVIACEIGWGVNHPHWNDELSEFNFLFSLGYKTDIDIENLQGTYDVLFVPEKR